MSHQCIISHAHLDADIARALATLIERVSLSNVRVWHSSDDTRSGGVGAGQKWFDTIIGKLKSGKVIIALITNEGSQKPWIYFESGFAAAQPEMMVIPVAVGLKDAHEIPAPLSAYQSYALIDQRSVSKFLEKILAVFNVKFDEEMAQKPMVSFVSEIARLTSNESNRASLPITDTAPKSGILFDPNVILSHIDRRLSDFIDVAQGRGIDSEYAVEIDIQFPRFSSTVSLGVGSRDSVQDMLNSLWGMLSEHVEAYRYMEEWILEDKKTGALLVVREIATLIPAQYVFRKDIRWVARPLSKPYSAVGGGEKTMLLQDQWDRR